MRTYWFKRLKREVLKMSPHFRFVHIRYGFWRIYWKDHYIHEVFEEMPPIGYDIEEKDPRLESLRYYEEYEDHPEIVRKLKNYVEGYYDSIQSIRARFYQLLSQKEFFERSQGVYKQAVIK